MFRMTCFLAVLSACAPGALVFAQNPSGPAQRKPLTIDFPNALDRARLNSQALQSAALDITLAREDRTQAKATLLPSLNYFNQYIYTQGNGTESGIFVSNDGVHLYNSQAVVHQELFSPERLAEYRRTAAAQSLAEAGRDIVERGLVGTVVQDYYAAVAARRRSSNAQRALEEAQRFVDITEKLQRGGEVARADVLKARLVLQQSRRDLQDAVLAEQKARIAMAVLMFSDYRTDFTLVDDLDTVQPLPLYADIEILVKEKSPDLRAAEEAVRQEEIGVRVARTAYLPSLSFDYFYGINANRFAVRDEEGRNRLGSSAQATLDIPVWNWWTVRSKVRQADARRMQAELNLELTRKRLIGDLHALYLEAQAALAQLDLLRNSVDDAAESLRLTSLRYQAGEVSVLEVVDAQSTLVQARNAHDDGLARYRLAFEGIRTLTGAI